MSHDDFEAGMTRIEELIGRVETVCSPEVLPLVRELVRSLLDVHRVGLSELLSLLEGTGKAELALARPMIASLLLMHDLHPESVETRVRRAVREANDVAGGRAQAELVRSDGADVTVFLSGGAASAALLERALERLVSDHAPDATLHIEKRLDAASAAPGPQLVPVERLRAKAGGAG